MKQEVLDKYFVYVRLDTLAMLVKINGGTIWLVKEIIKSDNIKIEEWVEYINEYCGEVFLEKGIVLKNKDGSYRWFWDVEEPVEEEKRIQEHKELVINIAKEKWDNIFFEEQNWNEMAVIKDNDLSIVLKNRKYYAYEIHKELLRIGKWFGYLYVPKGWFKK